MIVKTFKAREGAHFTDADAQVIGTYLESRFGDSQVTPDDFVGAAKSKRSPLHKFIEWDDATAANDWRRQQARMILASIEIVQVADDGAERRTRQYHNVAIVTDEGVGRAYVPQQVVWATPDLRSQVIQKAANEAERAASRLDEYEDLASQAGTLRDVAVTLREMAA